MYCRLRAWLPLHLALAKALAHPSSIFTCGLGVIPALLNFMAPTAAGADSQTNVTLRCGLRRQQARIQ